MSDVIEVVSPQGFTGDDIRAVINELSNEGLLYSTIDEDHWLIVR